jgi:hypothetical protein
MGLRSPEIPLDKLHFFDLVRCDSDTGQCRSLLVGGLTTQCRRRRLRPNIDRESHRDCKPHPNAARFPDRHFESSPASSCGQKHNGSATTSNNSNFYDAMRRSGLCVMVKSPVWM